MKYAKDMIISTSLSKPVYLDVTSYHQCYLNCTVSNVALSTFLKANIHTLPRYLSKPPYHLLYIRKV